DDLRLVPKTLTRSTGERTLSGWPGGFLRAEPGVNVVKIGEMGAIHAAYWPWRTTGGRPISAVFVPRTPPNIRARLRQDTSYSVAGLFDVTPETAKRRGKISQF
ncbi:MAG: hypothetical protein AB7F89_14070, partial [Pirellulaceae bacterium]